MLVIPAFRYGPNHQSSYEDKLYSETLLRYLAGKGALLTIAAEVIMGMRVGYARVSSLGQKLDVQLDKLSDCDRIYHEKVAAGTTKLRIELQKALDFVRDDDVFVVTKLDRLARSVVDLSIIVQRLEEKKVDLVVLDQGIDTTTIYGRLQFNILASIGEFERGLIRERSREGREKAIARGVRFGAKAKLGKEEIAQLVENFEAPGCSKVDIAEHYGISRSSVYRLHKGHCNDLC